MKCQHCERPATFHITELTGGKPQELHLCEDHARQYLTSTGGEPSGSGGMAAALAQQVKQMAIGQTAEELANLDQQACPICGITFYEFRSQGRLGCPHDYVVFRDGLEPLLKRIHRSDRHVGKSPRRQVDQVRHAELLDLRKRLQEAVQGEAFEEAARLRDLLRKKEATDESG